MRGWILPSSSNRPSDDDLDLLLRLALRQLRDQLPRSDIWQGLHDQIVASAHAAPRSHVYRPLLESHDGHFAGGNPFWGLTLRPLVLTT